MKLNHHYTFNIFNTHDSVCKTLRYERLSNTWSTLKNNVLFVSKYSNDIVIGILTHVNLVKKIINGIRRIYHSLIIVFVKSSIIKQVFDLLDKVTIRCDIRQSLLWSLMLDCPISLMRPFYCANVIKFV